MISFSWSWQNHRQRSFPAQNQQQKLHNITKNRTMPLSRKPGWCTQGRLGDQLRKCHRWLLFFALLELPPARQVAVYPRTRKQRSAKRRDILSWKQVLQNSLVLCMMKGWDFAQSHADFLVFFSLFDHGSLQATRANRHDDRPFFCTQSYEHPEVKFHSNFRCTITKMLCSAWGSP